jgi:hypothetical protein
MDENLKKMLVIMSVAPIISDYLEDLKIEMPNIVRHSLKKSFNETVKGIEHLYNMVFSGLNEQTKKEIAEEVHNTNIGFEQWIEENFVIKK